MDPIKPKYILLADGGSTKADWRVLDIKNAKVVDAFQTPGLNPEILDDNQLRSLLQNSKDIQCWTYRIHKLFFYGAGCGTTQAQQRLEKIFRQIFPQAQITVEEDMLGAALATAGHREGIIGILGTGSNACYYDGSNIFMRNVSLGYLIMDEGSGNYFGKILLRDYFYGLMPAHLRKDFAWQFPLDPDHVKRQLYHSDTPNAYLASFMPFLHRWRHESYVRDLLHHGFSEFFRLRVLPYPSSRELPLFFVGSVAWFFADELKAAANDFDLQVEQIIRYPAEGLVRYFEQKFKD